MSHPNDPYWPGTIGSIPDEPDEPSPLESDPADEPTDALPEPDQLPPMRDRGPGPDAARCAECGTSIHVPLCRACQCGELRKDSTTFNGEP